MPLRGTTPHFVGRADELELLSNLLDRARSGSPTTVLVYGEAGVGKTRLVAELLGQARGQGVRTLVGACASVGGRSLAFAPFAEALRPLTGGHLIGADIDDAGPGGPLLAGFVSRLSGGNGDTTRHAGDPTPSLRVGEMTQTRLFEEVVDTLEHIASPAGALLVVEDLHWADPSSRSLFDFVARNQRRAAIALLGTVRNDEPPDPELSGWLAELRRGAGAVRIDLEPFTRPELVALMEALLGERPSDQVADRVYDRSGGNAFLAQELLATEDGGGEVPPTVRDLLLARTTQLSPGARQLFGMAAVSGLEVDHGLLASASGIRGDELEAAVRELVEHQLLVVTPAGSTYAFRHALTREAAYGDLLPGERQRFHAALAVTLAEQATAGARAGVAAAIAEHWDAAGDAEQALPAHVDAGHAAEGLYAYADALRHYERALELWDRGSEPASIGATDRPRLRARAAEVASAIGQDERAIGYVEAAITELEASGGPPSRIGVLYHRLGWYLTRDGRDRESDAAVHRAEALIPAEPPTAERAHVLAILAGDLMVAGRYSEALRGAGPALEVALRARARKQEAAARIVIGSCLVNSGQDIDRGLAELHRALDIGREIADTEEVMLATINVSDCLIRLGRYGEAATVALDGAEAGQRAGAARSEVGFIMLNAAEALIPAGRWDEAEDIAQRVLQLRAGVQVDLIAHTSNALIHAYRGRLDAASAELERADALGKNVTQPQVIEAIETARAHAALASSDLARARRAAAHMLDVFGTTEEAGRLVSQVALAVRIEADWANVALARRDLRSQRDGAAAARALAERARSAASTGLPPCKAAHLVLCEAELGRAEGRSDYKTWREVAEAFVASGQPYPAAYARFREGEAALAAGADREWVVAALNAAHGGAKRLGAVPLMSEIEALARRARISLAETAPDTPSAPDDGSTAPARQEPPFGLTARELDVLRLVAAGQTNPQIAVALYISRKTASHHVSNILSKLGVATRVEAAGVAHLLGLDRDAVGPK